MSQPATAPDGSHPSGGGSPYDPTRPFDPTNPSSLTSPANPASPVDPTSPGGTLPVDPATVPVSAQPVPYPGSPYPGQPYPAAPYSGPPAPGPAYAAGAPVPGYAPGNAAIPGYPGAPVSGPAYGTPVSGPAYGAPYPTGVPPTSSMPLMGAAPTTGMPGFPAPGYPVPPKRGRTVPVLAGLAALFFVGTVLFAGLFFAKNSGYHKQVSTVAARNATITAQSSQLDQLKTQLKTTQDELTDETQKASGTQNQVDELNHEKQVISNCIDLQNQAVEAYLDGDKTKSNSLSKQADTACTEASKYLD
jgi:hypothetical protein